MVISQNPVTSCRAQHLNRRRGHPLCLILVLQGNGRAEKRSNFKTTRKIYIFKYFRCTEDMHAKDYVCVCARRPTGCKWVSYPRPRERGPLHYIVLRGGTFKSFCPGSIQNSKRPCVYVKCTIVAYVHVEPNAQADLTRKLKYQSLTH